jgi:hypothetical protein
MLLCASSTPAPFTAVQMLQRCTLIGSVLTEFECNARTMVSTKYVYAKPQKVAMVDPGIVPKEPASFRLLFL